MIKKPGWIVCSQEKEALARFGAHVVWVNRCLRCNAEMPVHEGPLETAISDSEKFILVHRECEAVKKPCVTCGQPNDQWEVFDECWECRIDESR